MFHQDQFIGRVRERPICICQDSHLEVFNDSDEKIYDINGPWCYLECCSVPFDVSCELVHLLNIQSEFFQTILMYF